MLGVEFWPWQSALACVAAQLPVLKDPAGGVMRSELPPGPFCTAVGTLPAAMGTWMGIAEDSCGHVCDHYCERRSGVYISRELS